MINYSRDRDLVIKNNPWYYECLRIQNRSILIPLVYGGHMDLITKMGSIHQEDSDPSMSMVFYEVISWKIIVK